MKNTVMLPIWLLLFQIGFAQQPLITTQYEKAVVVFYIAKGDGLGKTYSIRGDMEVKVFENWVNVAFLTKDGKPDPERKWILPRERVVYIGEEFD